MRQMKTNPLIMDRVLPHFFGTLLVSFLGMFVGGMFIPEGIAAMLIVVPIGILIVMMFKAFFSDSKNPRGKKLSSYGMRLPMWLVYFFTAVMGIALYPVIKMYVSTIGAGLVLVAFAITTVTFGGLFVYTLITKRDFSGLGGFLFAALLGIILLYVVNMFMDLELLDVLLAFAGVLVFSGYTLYDISRMKQDYFSQEDVPAAVFDLYLNFINILLDILRIIAFFKSDD
jgi:uncharacterized protein